MNTVYSVFGIAVAGALLYSLLQRQSPSFALLLAIAAALLILSRAAMATAELLGWLRAIQLQGDGTLYFILLRTAALLLLTDYVCTLCREAGAASVGWCCEFAGRCMILVTLWPMLQQLYQVIWELTGG